MHLRPWNRHSDYKVLVKWWDQYDFGKVPKECLPPLGLVVEDALGTSICAGGLYCCTGTKFGFMEWIVANKTANLKSIHKGLNLCITEIFKLAKKYNIELIYSMTANTSLHKRYTKYHNMKLVENNVKTFLMDLTKSYTDLEWISDDQQLKEQLKDK